MNGGQKGIALPTKILISPFNQVVFQIQILQIGSTNIGQFGKFVSFGLQPLQFLIIDWK